MNIEPIRHYAEPHLPTRQIVDQHPELLRLLPRRWQNNAAVVAALTACVALTNCSRSQAADARTYVAPVFEHGKGAGTFGCSAVNPPIFLSEADARQVIVEEAKRVGIDFQPDGKTLTNIELPTDWTYEQVTDASGKTKYDYTRTTQVRSIPMDGLDKQRDIAFDYVSEQDLKDWKTGVATLGTSGSEDLIGTAKALRDGIAKTNPGGTYGVFYDPAIGYRDAQKKVGNLEYSTSDSSARRAEINAGISGLAREELRKQVQDFIKWLKAQGVI